MESGPVITDVVEDVGELVSRMILGGILFLLLLGLAGYFTLKAVRGINFVREFDLAQIPVPLLVCGAFWLVVLIPLSWGGWTFIKASKELPKARALSRWGQEIEGVVVELREMQETSDFEKTFGCLNMILSIFNLDYFSAFPNTPAIYMIFAYQVGGKTYRARKQIFGDRLRKIEKGARVQVHYLPTDPEVAQESQTRNIADSA